MPNEVKRKQGTAITWRGTGGDYGISLESVADGAAAQGAKGDLGATFAAQYNVLFLIETGAVAPSAGTTYDLYWAASTSATAGTDNPGGTSGTDAAYKAGEEEEWARQLDFVGSLVMTNDATTKQTQILQFSPPARYGMPVVINNSGQTSETNHDEHKIVLTPIIDEVQ